MTQRRLPPPLAIEDIDAAFVVKDHIGQRLAFYVYYEDEPGRQAAAKLLSKDEARKDRIALIAKLPIVCAIDLMYCHASLYRAPDHVFCSAAARKRHNQIGLAFVEHPLIAKGRR